MTRPETRPTTHSPSGMDPIALRGVSKVFETGHAPVTALEPIDLDIEAGSFVSLLGPSGCGKTTLLRMIGGLEQPTSGSIRVGSDSVDDALRARVFGFVFQDPTLLPWRTVQANASLLLDVTGQHAHAGDNLLSQELDKWTSTHDFLFEAGVIEEEVDPTTLFTEEFSP